MLAENRQAESVFRADRRLLLTSAMSHVALTERSVQYKNKSRLRAVRWERAVPLASADGAADAPPGRAPSAPCGTRSPDWPWPTGVFRKGRPSLLSTAVLPGRSASSRPARAVAVFAAFLAAFGAATSPGLGALQANSGLAAGFGVPANQGSASPSSPGSPCRPSPGGDRGAPRDQVRLQHQRRRGRTVREFVLGVLVVPTPVSLARSAVMGGTA